MSLKKFIKIQNSNASWLGEVPIDIKKIDVKTAENIFYRLDLNLCQEVMYQDGERSHAKAMKFKADQEKAIDDLIALGFAPPNDMYNWSAK